MSRTVDYFFAPHSPWTYLGHARFVQVARDAGAQVNAKPMDLARVFPVSGGLPLAKRAPQRQAYRLVELKRFSQHLGVLRGHGLLESRRDGTKAFYRIPDPRVLKMISLTREIFCSF